MSTAEPFAVIGAESADFSVSPRESRSGEPTDCGMAGLMCINVDALLSFNNKCIEGVKTLG